MWSPLYSSPLQQKEWPQNTYKEYDQEDYESCDTLTTVTKNSRSDASL